MRGEARERGSAAVELAILAPTAIVFFIAVVMAGRLGLARQAADAAAYDAARTASLARTEATAGIQARDAAARSFAAQGIRCRTMTVATDTSGFDVPVGQSATVRVSLTCVADFTDIILPGMPGSATLTSTFTSPLDKYRSRG
ncbi:TadE/TadG family type IV pilus assembly protein [Catellatospora sp. KI3]|uniref:TadE/TadG family type IV pilus assembly protein n=1 Tax=Catellatospora sp. KI3 TaxID=3041620 RepID=UPI00248316CA|nr:TadE/TadG family type IV pilus assembly protein [Catellatospora sp. KI3]MDI1462101.1 TadE/TadG family type IV pilus assembly protein [Catellatospora sp. KI3]